ncbi:MAG TPA: hypothetical protein VGK37_00165 [Casimicrobiaceae bacterium]|jgi:hypothetical protein
MGNIADCVLAYILAKDGNRPHLLDAAFTDDVELRMIVQTNAISFPPVSKGREALADTVVRHFNQTYENIYTFCLTNPPHETAKSFCCPWLVAMSEKQSRTVRVSCGRYDWSFTDTGLACCLVITVRVMEVLPAEALKPVIGWVSPLPYPWCIAARAAQGIPALAGLRNFALALHESGA